MSLFTNLFKKKPAIAFLDEASSALDEDNERLLREGIVPPGCEIKKEARLVGDIKTARIIIEDGAYFKGSIDIVKPEPAKVTQSKPQQQAPAPTASHAPAPAGAPDVRR